MPFLVRNIIRCTSDGTIIDPSIDVDILSLGSRCTCSQPRYLGKRLKKYIQSCFNKMKKAGITARICISQVLRTSLALCCYIICYFKTKWSMKKDTGELIQITDRNLDKLERTLIHCHNYQAWV